MTSLYTRLLDIEGEKIACDTYVSACEEQRRSAVTRQQIVDAFSLTSSEGDDHDDVIARMNGILGIGALPAVVMRDSLIMQETGVDSYTEAQLKTRWGI